jgi:hypothetical protein
MESLERVFPLEVRGVVSRRFKVGNTAGEYTECGSSPHRKSRDPVPLRHWSVFKI